MFFVFVLCIFFFFLMVFITPFSQSSFCRRFENSADGNKEQHGAEEGRQIASGGEERVGIKANGEKKTATCYI